MAVKAIFSECSSPLWLDVGERLTRKHGWRPCYWIAVPSFERSIKKRFPDIVFHSSLDAARGLPSPDFADFNCAALDQPLLKDLSFCKSVTLRMMDRMDRNNSFSFEEREHLFHVHLRYWIAVLDYFKPDVVVSSVSPHLIYDYVLYNLCKKRNIKNIMFRMTSLDGMIYPIEHFENGSKSIKNLYSSLLKSKLQNVTLSDETEKQLKKISGDYSDAVPFYMKDQFEKKQIVSYVIKRIMKNPDNISSMIQKGRCLFLRGHYIKQRGKKIEDSNMKSWGYLWCEFEGMKKKKMLKRHYEKLERKADFDCPYIYFPLHYQPENTTSPLGEAYADQFLIVHLLSKYLPEDWWLYVKEHSSQWHATFHGECSRTTGFYDDIVSLPNVKLIPLSTSNFDLIDHSKAVVTVTGTTGWEGIVRGKPVLIFGHAWYKGCEGVFYISSEEECRDVLSKIESGYKVDKNLVRLFVHVLEQICIKGYVDTAYEKVADVSYEENVSTLTDTIHKFFMQITSERQKYLER